MSKIIHTALILGGSSGLGLASARKLAREGMNICIVHRTRKSDMDSFLDAIDEMRSHGVFVSEFNKDALKPDTTEEVVNSLPDQSVKLLLHSIAKGSLKPLGGENALGKEDLDITLYAMGHSWLEWTQALIRANKFSEDARNLAFTSEGNSKVWPGYAAVSAAKATLEAMMRSMAVEFAGEGLKTNCIQAGATETPSFNMIPGSETLAETARKRNPFGRLTTPEDVANVVYLLSTDEARWINGTVIKADGGESLR